MNKDHYKMMRVTNVKLSIDKEGLSTSIKKGMCLIDLRRISTVFKADEDGEIELVTNDGERFIVKNIDIVELKHTLERINDQ